MPDDLVLPQTVVSYNKFTQEYSRLKRTLIELLQTCYNEYKHIFVNILNCLISSSQIQEDSLYICYILFEDYAIISSVLL